MDVKVETPSSPLFLGAVVANELVVLVQKVNVRQVVTSDLALTVPALLPMPVVVATLQFVVVDLQLFRGHRPPD